MGGQTEEKYEKLWCALACVGAAVALMALGVLSNWVVLFLTSLFVPAALITAGARGGALPAVLGVVATCVLVWLFAGTNIAVITGVCLCFPVFVMTWVIRRKKSFYYSTLISCLTLFASLGLLLLLVWLLYGADLMTILLGKVEGTLNANPEFTKLYYSMYHALANGSTTFDITAAMNVPLDTAVASLMRTFSTQLALLVPQAAMFCVALFGLLNYVIPRAIVKKLGVAVGKVPSFSNLSLPSKFGTWSLVALLVAFVGTMLEWRNFELVYALVMGFFSITYMIQGMAFTDWLLKKKISSVAGRFALIIVIFLVLQLLGFNLYMWVGFLEQIIKFRKRAAVQG